MANHKVHINIKVTDFRNINDTGDAGRFCLIKKIEDVDISETPAANPGQGLVQRLDGDDRTIRLKKPTSGHIDLEFEVFGPGGGTDYTVAGIILNNRGFDTKHSKGNNFDAPKVEDNKVTITNRYVRGRTFWELYIAIQHSDGRIGLIDPGVENSDP